MEANIESVLALGDSADLDRHLRDLPGQIYFWGSAESAAQEALLRAKSDLEQTHARVYLACKEQGDVQGRKLTETTVESMIQLDPDYQRAHTLWMGKDAEVRKVRAMVEALRAKRDVLVQLGSNWRTEMQAGMGPSIKSY